MRLGLFIPCYVDQLFPSVGVAALRLLQHFSVGEIDFPFEQTCCGQPMANAGCTNDARRAAARFLDVFGPYDYVVAPSASCVAMVRHHYHGLVDNEAELTAITGKTFELCEFMTDVLGVTTLAGHFPHRVGLHQSCHGVRELQLAASTEKVGPRFNKVRTLLESLRGIELVELERPDECCGFGGTFSVFEEAVSCMMGQDRIDDHQRAGAAVITSTDMSCLMHLDGLIRREKRPLRVLHVAELLAESLGLPLTSPVAGSA